MYLSCWYLIQLILMLMMCVPVVVRVWNDAVAHRLATLGHAPIQGDLVWQQQDPQGDMGESNPPQVIHLAGNPGSIPIFATCQCFSLLTPSSLPCA